MCFAPQNFPNAWADVGASFEIEAKRNHVECGAVHALREEILRRIGQVGTVLAQDVVETKVFGVVELLEKVCHEVLE